jgi:hypothetical protein
MSNNSRKIFGDNKFGDIPSKASKKFEPKVIVHYILDISEEQGSSNKGGSRGVSLKFEAIATGNTPGPEGVASYAKKVAIEKKGPGRPGVPSQYDMEISQQCWLVVQLNPEIKNWQFATNLPGCTTKASKNKRNCLLHHVYEDGTISLPGDVVAKDRCQVLYFGVVTRGGKKNPTSNNPPGDLFNFHIEFLQKDTKERLSVIFDPDVKNNGEIPIPPPPTTHISSSVGEQERG